MIKAGVVGATGYTGLELLRLLVKHPQATIHVVTSRAESGKPVADIFPGLRGEIDLCFSEHETSLLKDCDIVFFATPNATAMHQVPALLQAGLKIIDLSADFRLQDAQLWSRWYGQTHAAEELLDQAVYGLPELHREKIAKASLVANPGCYPTAVILALIPALEAGIIDPQSIIADAKSGISGAGRKAELHNNFCEASENFKAYAVPGHRHLPEICQALNTLAKKTVSLTFVPHLVPMVRGIHATVYAQLLQKKIDIQSLYEKRYKDEPFIDVMPMGSHPDTRSVRGSNYCRLAAHTSRESNTLVLLSVIDNLTKGAAGQAIQNMNIMFGLDETAGLTFPPLSP
ncbi:MAG: argC [Gammaproteobacteria bacterium]|nr:argC [Gammaproteobacteria bacterium]